MKLGFFTRLLHNTLGWAWPESSVWGFNGNRFTARCSVCGARIVRDDWGSWHHIEAPPPVAPDPQHTDITC